jgi:transcriptional regulator with XRE-family HTH domain
MRPSRPGQKEPNPGPGYLAERVTHLRRKAGLSQWDLSGRAGLTYAVVRSVEKGQREFVRVRTLAALAGGLSLSVAMLHGSPDPSGPRVREAREQLGMAQRTLALLAGVPLWQLSEFERGLSLFTCLSTADAMASAVGLSVWDLVPWLAENRDGGTGQGDGNS